VQEYWGEGVKFVVAAVLCWRRAGGSVCMGGEAVHHPNMANHMISGADKCSIMGNSGNRAQHTHQPGHRSNTLVG
jgi:hypothetical protein